MCALQLIRTLYPLYIILYIIYNCMSIYIYMLIHAVALFNTSRGTKVEFKLELVICAFCQMFALLAHEIS